MTANYGTSEGQKYQPSSNSRELFDLPTSRTGSDYDSDGSGTSGCGDPEKADPESYLPPQDRGKEAWLFLVASCLMDAVIWGFAFSFGVFKEYYGTHEPFASQGNTAIIGTCSLGMLFLFVPFTLAACRTWPAVTRWTPLIGILTMCISLALSSFAQTVAHLVVLQGVFYGLGGSIAYCACILYIDTWFKARQSLAYGLMWSGTSIAGVLLPLLMSRLLDTLGFRWAIRVWALLALVLTLPLSYYVKPRCPPSSASSQEEMKRRNKNRRNPLLSLVLSPTFHAYSLPALIQSTGFFLPNIFLPSYALKLSPSSSSAMPVLLLNLSTAFGSPLMGLLVDKLKHVTSCIILSTTGAVLSVFLLWGLLGATSLGWLYGFCVLYGLTAGSYASCWPGMMTEVCRGVEKEEKARRRAQGDGEVEEKEDRGEEVAGVELNMVFSLLAAERGVGNLVSGPVSDVLVQAGQGWAYGNGQGALVVFTGVTALIGGASWIFRRFGWL